MPLVKPGYSSTSGSKHRILFPISKRSFTRSFPHEHCLSSLLLIHHASFIVFPSRYKPSSDSACFYDCLHSSRAVPRSRRRIEYMWPGQFPPTSHTARTRPTDAFAGNGLPHCRRSDGSFSSTSSTSFTAPNSRRIKLLQRQQFDRISKQLGRHVPAGIGSIDASLIEMKSMEEIQQCLLAHCKHPHVRACDRQHKHGSSTCLVARTRSRERIGLTSTHSPTIKGKISLRSGRESLESSTRPPPGSFNMHCSYPSVSRDLRSDRQSIHTLSCHLRTV